MDVSSAVGAAPVASDLYSFDLCVLAYQLYNQSLIWPLDPFYEEWARPGSRRRDNVMALVHNAVTGVAHLRGPGSTRGWATNPELDPVLTNYSRVDPNRAVITNDGTRHRLMQSHDSVVGDIAQTTIAEYQTLRHGQPADPYFAHQTDHRRASASKYLYGFEGATGSFDGRPPAWSLLGLVLDQATADGYEVHVAFRGSQSGDAYRAAYQGFVAEAGNPDWVTDMEFLQTVADQRISPDGRVTLGLRDSVLASLGTLVYCLEDIARRRGRPPQTLHITGHSLGGALAVQLASALSVGSVRSALPESLKAWPLDHIHLTTFGAQKSGDAAFARVLSPRVAARRIWIHGDPIPEFPANEHVGMPVRLENGRVGPVNHEVGVTRRALIDELHWQRQPLDPAIAQHQPWQDFDDLGTALHVATTKGLELADLFDVDEEADRLLSDIVASAIREASSYKVPWTKPPAERKRRSRRVIERMTAASSSLDDLAAQVARIHSVQPGSAETYLRRWFVVREGGTNGWPIGEVLNDRRLARALGTYRRVAAQPDDNGRDVALASGPEVEPRDVLRVKAILAMRTVHRRTVHEGTESSYRRRVPPISGMPKLVRACGHYKGLEWLPKELMVPESIPAEGQLPLIYKAKYYGLGKLGFAGYARSPIRKDVPWHPESPWRTAFVPPEDGWSEPTNDDTFVRLRLQGPNPFDLRKEDDGFVLDFGDLFDGVLPRIAATFDVQDGELRPRQIDIGRFTHRPNDPTWDRAKRVVNAADIRVVPFLRHLLEVHFIVGQAFALGAFSLPTWHPLRPFMHFFSYGTLQVNDFAYQAFFVPSSYFVASGFVTGDAAATLLRNRIDTFSFDSWNPVEDIAARGLDEITGHPYAEDARRIWPEFVECVSNYLDAIGLDDEAVRNDDHLDIWYRTIGMLIPNFDARETPLDRTLLVEILSSFLYNNVVHEVCGDLSPILRSDDPNDKAITNLERLAEAVGEGRLDRPIPAPTMNDVFLMDQASDASRFNVGGNNLLRITPERWIDEPQLSDAVHELQSALTRLDLELEERNRTRSVRFGRMQPRHWEASISF